MGRTPKKRRENGASLTPLLGSIQFVEDPRSIIDSASGAEPNTDTRALDLEVNGVAQLPMPRCRPKLHTGGGRVTRASTCSAFPPGKAARPVARGSPARTHPHSQEPGAMTGGARRSAGSGETRRKSRGKKKGLFLHRGAFKSSCARGRSRAPVSFAPTNAFEAPWGPTCVTSRR